MNGCRLIAPGSPKPYKPTEGTPNRNVPSRTGSKLSKVNHVPDTVPRPGTLPALTFGGSTQAPPPVDMSVFVPPPTVADEVSSPTHPLIDALTQALGAAACFETGQIRSD
ncbi:hypothetical protein ACAW74_05405 [Fibrella sp. WM1]|uniref:hypothetical protein n=1 Tax=Fibrella musci TaxID=3242485 RepID=UPI0035207D3A